MFGHKKVHDDINNEENIAGKQKAPRPKVLGKERLNRTVMTDIGNSMANTRQQTLLKTHNGSCKPFQTKQMMAKSSEYQKAPQSPEKQVCSLPELPDLHLDQMEEVISLKHQAHQEFKPEKTRVNDLHDEYADDIPEYLTSVEKQDPVPNDYLQGTSGCVKPESRAILIDWLVDVHQAFGLCPETLYLTVALIDRYLKVQHDRVRKNHLQLIGVTALFIAAKYEEVRPVRIADICYMTDNGYSKGNVRRMERRLLSSLDFKLGHPGAYSFSRKMANKLKVPRKSQVFETAQYAQELALVEYKLSDVPPSILALAGLTFAHKIHKGQEVDSEMWSTEIERHFGSESAHVYGTVRKLAKLVLAQVRNERKLSTLQAVRNKYKHIHCLVTGTNAKVQLIKDLAKGLPS